MTLLTGMTEQGVEVPVQVKPDGRLVAEGLTGPAGPIGPTGPTGPAGPAGAEYWKKIASDIYYDAGRLLVGTSSQYSGISGQLLNTATAGAGACAGLAITTYSASTGISAGCVITLDKSNSNTLGTNKAVTNNDQLGTIAFRGADGGSNFRDAAYIQCFVDGTVSGGGAADMPGRLVFSTTADGAASPTERMRIKSDGEVRSEGTFAGSKFLLKRSSVYSYVQIAAFDYDPGAGGATAGQVVIFCNGNDGSGGSGGVSLSRNATSWGAYSDERAKVDLINIENGLAKVGTLRAVTGRYIVDEEGTSRSFLIAQDVQAVLPEAVDASDPDKLNLRYAEVIPLLVAALKESKERIEILEQRLTDAGIA